MNEYDVFWNQVFVLFLQEGATNPEIGEKENDTDIESAPQEQTDHNNLTSFDGAHKNNRSGKLVNIYELFSMLKGQYKNI